MLNYLVAMFVTSKNKVRFLDYFLKRVAFTKTGFLDLLECLLFGGIFVDDLLQCSTTMFVTKHITPNCRITSDVTHLNSIFSLEAKLLEREPS